MKRLLILGLVLSVPGTSSTSWAGWVPVPLVTAESRARGHSGGEGGQNSRALAIDSTGNFLMFCNDVAGFYRSLDGGAHWEPANIGMLAGGCHSVAIDPNNSDRVLVVGSDADASLSWLTSGGIHLSTDRGRTWSQRLQVVTPNWFDINEIAWDPSSASGGMSQVAYWSTSGDFDVGLYKTTDAGQTWSLIQTGPEYAYGSVAVHPTLGYVYIAKSSGFFRSTDGGASFSQILYEDLRGVSAVAAAPDRVAVSGTAGIWVSTDAGATFTRRAGTGLPTYGIGPYGIRISPADPSRMMIAYNGPPGYWWDQGMWYSHDGGDTWNRPIVDDTDVYYSPFAQDDFNAKGRVWHPTNPDVLFITSDWIMKSSDGGLSVSMSNDGNNGTLVVAHWSFNPQNPDLIAFGVQDWISSLSADGGWTWINFPNIYGGAGYGAYAFSTSRLFLGVGGWSGTRTLNMSTDGGASWTEPGPSTGETDIAVSGDPGDPNVAFWSYWRTDDQGDTWNAMSGCDRVFTYNPSGANELYGTLGAQYPPGTSNTVVASTDHGVTWSPVFTAPNIIWDLAHDPVRDRFYVTIGDRGDTTPQLYQWESGALTDITDRLPADQKGTREAHTVAVDPVDPSVVYAGGSRWDYLTDAAIMRSLDAGATWTSLTLRPGDVGIDGGGRETGAVRVHPVTRWLWVTGGCQGIWKHTPPGAAPACGDSVCEAPDETPLSCPQDCTNPCGNATCDAGETCASCPQDCGPCQNAQLACQTTAALSIDGRGDDWPSVAATPLPAFRSLPGEPEPLISDADSSAWVRTAWDATYLYVLVEVTDDRVVDDSTVVHLDDGVELYLDGGYERAPSYDTNDFQLSVDVGDAAGGVRGDQLVYQHATAPAADGYGVEYAVPWTALGGVAAAGRVLGFDVAINDDDDGGDTRESQLVLYGTGRGYFDPRDMGTLTLSANEGAACTGPGPGAPSRPAGCGCRAAGPNGGGAGPWWAIGAAALAAWAWRRRRGLAALVALLWLLVDPALARAAEVVVPPTGDWAAAIEALSPGDVALLRPGRYTGGPSVTVRGAPGNPITIRGAGVRESIFDGETGWRALFLRECADLVIENVTVTNASPNGWDLDGRRPDFEYVEAVHQPTAEGILVYGGERITIRNSRFADIATRGILVEGNDAGVHPDRLVLERNLFVRIGDDTASGDINCGGFMTRWTVRENLFAGNVDGFVCHWTGAEGLLERNLFVFGRHENNIDIKYHWQKYDEDPWSTIRHNVVYGSETSYGAIAIQDGSSNLRLYGNVIHGTSRASGPYDGRGALGIRGRSYDTHDIVVVGNWFDVAGTGGSGVPTSAVSTSVQSDDPGAVANVSVLHNVFSGFDVAADLGYGTGHLVYNNVFSSSSAAVSGGNVTGGTNLYDATPSWSGDGSPIVGTPVYTEAPVGPLAAGSPGQGAATVLPGYDFGTDVGLPPAFGSLVGLEQSILCALQETFTFEEIKECMDQAGRPYAVPVECGQPPAPDGGDDGGAHAGPSAPGRPTGCGCRAAGPSGGQAGPWWAIGAAVFAAGILGAWRRRARQAAAHPRRSSGLLAGLVLVTSCVLAACCTAETARDVRDAAQGDEDAAGDAADGGVIPGPNCNVIFASGFEGNDVRFEGVYGPYLVGVDTVFDQLYPGRANWSARPFADTSGHELPGAFFNHIVGNRSFGGVGGMSGEHAYTEIVQGVSFSGTSSLHPVVIQAIPEDLGGMVRSQWGYNLVPDHGLERGYVGFRLRLQPDIAAIMADNTPGGDWQTLFQLRERFGGCEPETMYATMVELNYQADTGLRFWTYRATNYCMGRTYDGSETSRQLVPTDGAWHHYEFFWDRDAGLFRWKLDGEIVVDWVGVRMKVAGPMQVLKPIYTYVSEPWQGDATRQTVERWYDDFFLCDDMPVGF